MDIVIYILQLLTFLGYPIISLIILKVIKLKRLSKKIRIPILFFLIHNIFFAFGYSLRGDYVDYFIFSFEYLVLCLLVTLCRPTNIFLKTFRIIGVIVISLGFFVGLIGIFIFLVGSQENVASNILHFENDSKRYETRMYTAGFATTDTRYCFETYRTYKYLPFEKEIDVTNFFDDKTDLDLGKDNLKISILNKDNKDQIFFKSTNGHSFYKPLN